MEERKYSPAEIAAKDSLYYISQRIRNTGERLSNMDAALFTEESPLAEDLADASAAASTLRALLDKAAGYGDFKAADGIEDAAVKSRLHFIGKEIQLIEGELAALGSNMGYFSGSRLSFSGDALRGALEHLEETLSIVEAEGAKY